MASIADILQRKWYGAHWSVEDDDYTTLQWLDENGLPSKEPPPSEKEIRDFSEEVDAMLVKETELERITDRQPTQEEYITLMTAEKQKWRTVDVADVVQE